MQNTILKFITSIILFVFLFISANAEERTDNKILLKTTQYEIDFKPDFENGTLSAICEITVKNISDATVNQIPLLLYRLLKVSSIKDIDGNKISFEQNVRVFEDWGKMQVNFIEVDLPKPLNKDEEFSISVIYDGYLLGYTETGMRYVQDNINPEFTILRPDCRAYPMVGYPNWGVNYAAGFEEYNYLVSTTVPDTLVVANGGQLVDKISKDGLTTYTYKNIKPAWRIDIIISKYKMLDYNKTKIYYFPEDEAGAKRLKDGWIKSFDLLTKWWGSQNNFNGFSVIEIPDGWGSQTDVTCVIQTAAAFKDPNELYQLYHEVTHVWEVKETDEYRARWQEGLAMFMQNLITEKLENKPSIESSFNNTLKRLISSYEKKPELKEIPFINFGKEGVHGLSYRVGQMMFSLLCNLLGEESFLNVHKKFYEKYYTTGATFNQFVEFYKNNCALNLDQFFDDWVFTPAYTKFLNTDYDFNKISAYYKATK